MTTPSVSLMASAATVLALLCSGCAQPEVGPATHALLEMQRQSAGEHPRTIDGEQATRSYQRYLKSFEYAIPEKFETGVGAGQ